MNKSIFIGICIFLILPLPASADTVYQNICTKARKLNTSNEYYTKKNVATFVDKYIIWNEQPYKRGISYAWYTRDGDCTEKAQLKTYMLSNCLGIKTRDVHGYLYGGKHDSFQYKLKNSTKWVSLDGIKVRGMGIWK